MSLEMSKEKEIFDYLYNLGCCKACCLRYICVRSPEVYGKVDNYIQEKKYIVDEVSSEELAIKKLKTNPCIVCLGLLQDSCISATVEKVSTNPEVNSYDSENFTCSVSYPACIYVREHSMRLDLDKKFPDFFQFETQETMLNKTWKWTIRDKLAENLNKKFENSETCDFSINVSIAYELDPEELSVLLEMQPEYFSTRQTQHRKFRGELYSRKGVLSALAQTNAGVFREKAAVPPTVPTKELVCDTILCSHNSIYLAGRYCKYSRELSQSPWIINGVKTMETSIQEIIFEPLQKMLEIPEDDLKFSSSGREDVDVRCLGNGRPFYIEYLNPKKTHFTFEEFRQVEAQINKSPLIKIKDLQLVAREELTNIKDGEESKTKQYIALCICLNGSVTDDHIKQLNDCAPVVLKQKTPIRVLHRRPLAFRDRTIHSLKAAKVPCTENNLFKINLTTQAGTYVKEFVHGDFERTKPNIGTIIGCEVDIVALDVVSIDLDWPKSVQYS